MSAQDLLERGHVEADHLLVAVGLGTAAHRIENAERDLRFVCEDLRRTRIELGLTEERGHLLVADHFENGADVLARRRAARKRLDYCGDLQVIAIGEVAEAAVEGDEVLALPG